MGLARVLVVDDSEAVLAHARAVLGARFSVATARNGVEGLERARSIRPNAILLDLSMPEMDGEQVLAALQKDPELAAIPVIVVSSEQKRADRCLGLGAAAVLHKPAAPEALIRTLDGLVGAARAAEEEAGMSILAMSVGQLRFAVPLANVIRVAPECATTPLPGAPSWISELVDLAGAPVAVADLARRLGTTYAEPRLERKLVFMRVGDVQLGLRVDRVFHPELVLASQLLPPSSIGVAVHPPLDRVLVAIAKVTLEPLPIIEPSALLSPGLVRELAAGIATVGGG